MTDRRFFPPPRGPFTLAQLAEIGGCGLEGGDPQRLCVDLASLDQAGADTISFFTVTKPQYLAKLEATKAGAVIVSIKHRSKVPAQCARLMSQNPQLALARIAEAFYPADALSSYVSNSLSTRVKGAIQKINRPRFKIGRGVVLGKGVEIGEGTIIGAGTVIENNVRIGKNVRIGANCVISYATIGDGAVIGHGTVVGTAGFGFVFDMASKQYVDVPQLGIVEIGAQVHLGDNVCVARGSFSNTVIATGARIDNLVQIAHNVQIGPFTAVAAQAGFAGSTIIGQGVQIGGQAGFAGHVEIGDGAMVAAQSGVARPVKAGTVVAGSPAVLQREWHQLLRIQRYLLNQASVLVNSDDVPDTEV